MISVYSWECAFLLIQRAQREEGGLSAPSGAQWSDRNTLSHSLRVGRRGAAAESAIGVYPHFTQAL